MSATSLAPQPIDMVSENAVQISKNIENLLHISVNDSHAEEISGEIKKFSMFIINQATKENIEEALKVFTHYLGLTSKSRATKIVKEMVDAFDQSKIDIRVKIEICKVCISYCASENRNFLRQSLEVKLVELLYLAGDFSQAISKIPSLSLELKKIENNEQLLRLRLVESKVYCSLSNLQKSRTALTNARTLSNAIFISQILQADLDMQTGLLNAFEHKDYKTAHSYLSESFEIYDLHNDMKAHRCLKHLITFYIMKEKGANFSKALNERLRMKYGTNNDLIALEEVSNAANKGSLGLFYAALQKYHAELVEDSSINTHLAILCEEITEKNIINIVKPYSQVQVTHIAAKIGLSMPQVEHILSTMILDKQISGVINQKDGVLILKKEKQTNEIFDSSLDAIMEMQKLVDKLQEHALAKC